MKIDLTTLESDKHLQIQGSESWLEPLYELMRLQGAEGTLRLRGDLYIKPIHQVQNYHVHGSVKLVTKLPCSRCCLSVSWPIEVQFEATFKPACEKPDHKLEIALRPEELDHYYLDEELTADMCQLLIDNVLGSLPSQILSRDETTGDCTVCGTNLETTKVFSDSQQSNRPNPFDALKKLKLPN